MDSDYNISQVNPDAVFQMDNSDRSDIDIQVATARRFPRNIANATNNAIAFVSMNKDIADACSYAFPRGGKFITGPTIHMAKIIFQCYGNMRVAARVANITEKHIVSIGAAWDLETNAAVAFEVRKSICNKAGARFSDDMITVTGNATNSIAFRNAVFSVVPKPVTDAVYQAAQQKITGDLSKEADLIKRRADALIFFNEEYGIVESDILKIVGKKSVNSIKSNEIALLLGITQSLKDGDLSLEELLRPYRSTKEYTDNRKKKMKKDKAPVMP